MQKGRSGERPFYVCQNSNFGRKLLVTQFAEAIKSWFYLLEPALIMAHRKPMVEVAESSAM